MSIEVLLLGGLIAANSYLIFTVILKDFTSSISRYFAYTSLPLNFWALGVALLISVNNPDLEGFARTLFLVPPMVTSYFLLLFAAKYPGDGRVSKRMSLLALLPVVILGGYLLLRSSSIITSINYSESGLNTFNIDQRLFTLYSLFFTVYFVLTATILWRKFVASKGLRRQQIKYAFIGILVSVTFASVTNLVLPALGVTELIWMGPLFTFAYLMSFALAIVKHGLFDLKAAAIRASTYIFSLASIGVIYALLLYGVLVIGGISDLLTASQVALLVLITLSTALLYQPLKDLFNRLTQQIFFRSSYKSEDFLDSFSNNISDEYEIKPLLDTSVELMIRAFNPENLEIVYRSHPSRGHHQSIRSSGARSSSMQAHKILEQLGLFKSKIVTRLIAYDQKGELRKIFAEYDASIMMPLSIGKDKIGYVVIGEKKSGNNYNQQDYQVLEIISDELALAIQNAIRYEQIEKFNETLQTEIEAATRKLQRSNEKLKALDVAKDEFISMASHQLRTPLTSVKGYISMVMEGDVGDVNEQQKKLLDQAFISSQRMVYLIADLLNVSRLRTGKFVIERRETYLPDVIEGEISQLYETASARGLKIKYKKPKDFPMLSLDETKIRQVVMNFTDNAIYYTPKGGTITVDLHATRTSVYFSVTDTGIGVPKAEVKNLFTKFYRAGNAKRARPDGTGLGLFMAKKVVVAQGGAMVFKTKEGKGSTFGFTFPRAKCEVKPKKK